MDSQPAQKPAGRPGFFTKKPTLWRAGPALSKARRPGLNLSKPARPGPFRTLEVIEGRAKIKKSSVVIEVGVSKSVCWTCSRFFIEVNRVFGIRIAYSRRHGKVYAGWAPPKCPFVSKYNLVLDAMQKAVEDEVEEIVRKANNKAKQGSSPLGFPSENIGMFGEAEKSVFTFMYVQS